MQSATAVSSTMSDSSATGEMLTVPRMIALVPARAIALAGCQGAQVATTPATAASSAERSFELVEAS